MMTIELPEEASPGSRPRKTILVYPTFQIRMIALQLLIIGGAILPVFAAIRGAFAELSSLAAEAGLPADHSFYRLMELQKQELYSRLGPALALALFASAVVTVFLSDRLAGPIVRLRRVFREMGESGEVQTIRFRRHDFFGDLPPIMNDALEKLGDKGP
jgi:hypothetical protein